MVGIYDIKKATKPFRELFAGMQRPTLFSIPLREKSSKGIILKVKTHGRGGISDEFIDVHLSALQA